MLYEDIVNNKAFYEKLEKALQTLIDRYSDYFDSHKKERQFILDNFARDLERIANLLNNYGYTRSTTSVFDMSEETFEVSVGRYLQSFQEFIDSGAGNLETLNRNVKSLLVLIDKHKSVSEHFV